MKINLRARRQCTQGGEVHFLREAELYEIYVGNTRDIIGNTAISLINVNVRIRVGRFDQNN